MSSFLPVDIEFASECLRFLFTRRPAQRHLHHTHSHSNSDTFTHKLTDIFIILIASNYFQLNHPDHHEQVVSTSLPDPPPLWTEMDALPLLHSTTPLLYYYSDTLLLRYSTTTTFTPLLHFYYYYNDHNYTSSLQNSPLKMLCFSFRTTRHFHCDF